MLVLNVGCCSGQKRWTSVSGVCADESNGKITVSGKDSVGNSLDGGEGADIALVGNAVRCTCILAVSDDGGKGGGIEIKNDNSEVERGGTKSKRVPNSRGSTGDNSKTLAVRIGGEVGKRVRGEGVRDGVGVHVLKRW